MAMLSFHRYRAASIALFLTAMGLWLWNQNQNWTLQHSSSLNLPDVPQSPTVPATTAHTEIIGVPAENAAKIQPEKFNIIERLFPGSKTESWMIHNRAALHELLTCAGEKNCQSNQQNIVLLTSGHFRSALDGNTDGEVIWAAAVALALSNLGYTYFYTYSLHDALPLYQAFPSNVVAALADDHDVESCLSSSEVPSCGQSPSFPSGIPPYKIFAFSFWSNPEHPLGAQWTLSPENYKALGEGENTYLGYSIEATCAKHRFVPHAERGANEAYILAKLLSFFLPERSCAWTSQTFNEATHATGITYISGSYNDTQNRDWYSPQAPDPEWRAPTFPDNFRNEGIRPQFEFLERLSRVRVLIGMGNPITSPTPYDALCLGVPFINPISSWDHDNPTDRSRWSTQHSPLSRLDPPYVYNVFASDIDGFVNAIRGAIENPIQPFVLEEMKIKAVERRLHAILQHDWEGEAKRLAL